MIKIIDRYFTHKDERGTIEGLIHTGLWGEINLITSKVNTKRGNHYHIKTTEVFIILDGEIEVILQKVKDKKLIGMEEKTHVVGGDIFIVNPMTNHIFDIIQESRWINVMSKPLSGINQDIFKVEN
jgi:mannose-6-phosphate isomerase-like protein (cupin superfamily)